MKKTNTEISQEVAKAKMQEAILLSQKIEDSKRELEDLCDLAKLYASSFRVGDKLEYKSGNLTSWKVTGINLNVVNRILALQLTYLNKEGAMSGRIITANLSLTPEMEVNPEGHIFKSIKKV